MGMVGRQSPQPLVNDGARFSVLYDWTSFIRSVSLHPLSKEVGGVVIWIHFRLTSSIYFSSIWLSLVALSILGISVALALLPTFQGVLKSAE